MSPTSPWSDAENAIDDCEIDEYLNKKEEHRRMSTHSWNAYKPRYSQGGRNSRYSSISTHDRAISPLSMPQDGLPDRYKNHSNPSLMRVLTSPMWFFATCLLFGFSISQWAFMSKGAESSSSASGSYAIGFVTEFASISSAVKIEQKKFTNSLQVDENGSLCTHYDDNDKARYTGPPSQEIDQAWEELLRGRYIRLTSAEQNKLTKTDNIEPFPETSFTRNAGYFTGPDVLYTLHCINVVRKHLDRDHYYPSPSSGTQTQSGRIYLDHCLDHIRQSVACAGDMTPVTISPLWNQTHSKDNAKDVIGWTAQTEKLHTCRSMGSIREWMSQRGKDTGMLDETQIENVWGEMYTP